MTVRRLLPQNVWNTCAWILPRKEGETTWTSWRNLALPLTLDSRKSNIYFMMVCLHLAVSGLKGWTWSFMCSQPGGVRQCSHYIIVFSANAVNATFYMCSTCRLLFLCQTGRSLCNYYQHTDCDSYIKKVIMCLWSVDTLWFLLYPPWFLHSTGLGLLVTIQYSTTSVFWIWSAVCRFCLEGKETTKGGRCITKTLCIRSLWRRPVLILKSGAQICLLP